MENTLLQQQEDVKLLATYLTTLKIKAGNPSYKDIADGSKSSESTVKNLCLAKVNNPGISTVRPVMEYLGGSYDEMYGLKNSKEEIKAAPSDDLKEVYEFQVAAMKQAHETERQLIRDHYESQLKKQEEYYEKEIKKQEIHYEHRLADKREIIASKDSEKKWFKWGFIISLVIFAGLCLAELANPTVGWIRF